MVKVHSKEQFNYSSRNSDVSACEIGNRTSIIFLPVSEDGDSGNYEAQDGLEVNEDEMTQFDRCLRVLKIGLPRIITCVVYRL